MRVFIVVLAVATGCAPAEPGASEGPDAAWLGVAPGSAREFGAARFANFDFARFAIDPNALPPAVDWRAVLGNSFVSGVRSQGPNATCVAFSATAAVESALAVQADRHDVDLAEQWLVTSCGTVDPVTGYYPERIGDDLIVHGMVDEARVPYGGDASACPDGVVADSDFAVTAAWIAVGAQVKAALLASPTTTPGPRSARLACCSRWRTAIRCAALAS